MTRGLRIAHRYIWLMLLIGIPVLIVLAIKGIEEPIFIDADVNISPKISKIIALDDDLFFIGIDKRDSINSLEIIIKKPLKNSSATVYGNHDNDKTYIGKIDKKGMYKFEVSNRFESITIYDGIKKVEILNQKLKWQ